VGERSAPHESAIERQRERESALILAILFDASFSGSKVSCSLRENTNRTPIDAIDARDGDGDEKKGGGH
jgi:hypothetical protein